MPDRVQELDEFRVALVHRRAELGAVDVKVVEQTLQRALGCRAARGILDVAEYPLQGLVQFLIPGRPLADIGKQLRGENEEPLLLHDALKNAGNPVIRLFEVVVIGIPGLVFVLVDVGGEVL